MSSGGTGRTDHTTDGADGSRWDTALEDESGPVVRAVCRQIKLWREAAGLTQDELGKAIGYSEGMVSAVERARRLPHPEFLDKADKVLGASGRLAAMKDDVADAKYPKKVRDLARLESEAVELGGLRKLCDRWPPANRGVRADTVQPAAPRVRGG